MIHTAQLSSRQSTHRALLLMIAMVCVSACAPLPRPERLPTELADARVQFDNDQKERLDTLVDRLVDRMELIKDGAAEDDTFDALLLSGGGDWGVFGAAFMIGWAQNEDLPRPEFDYLAGISTGSLIAAYTVSGREERYAEIERYYLDFDPGAVRFRGIFGGFLGPLLANSSSLVDTRPVQQAVDGAIDDALLEEIATAHAEKRSVTVGAVNLDMGAFNVFDIGDELARAEDPKDRLASILLASSAVPVLLEPVEIDGDLYVDGGASVGIPIFRLEIFSRIFGEWRRRRSDEPPEMRIWLIFNNKIGVRPRVTDLGWTDIMFRSYKVAIQTSIVPPTHALGLTADLARKSGAGEITVNWIAIPRDFPETEGEAFNPEQMRRLKDLGRRMGADVESWNKTVPDF